MPDHIPEERNLPMYALIYNCTTDAAVLKGYVHEQQTSKQERDAVKEFSSRLEAVEKDEVLKMKVEKYYNMLNSPDDTMHWTDVGYLVNALRSLVPSLSKE